MMARYVWFFLYFFVMKLAGCVKYPVITEEVRAEVTLPNISEEDLKNAFEYAANKAEERLEIEDNYIKSGGTISATEISAQARLFGILRDRSMSQHRIQEQLEDATKFIAKAYNLTEEETTLGLPKLPLPDDVPLLQQCKRFLESGPCDGSYKYRTADGSCNNLAHPNWGRAFGASARLTKADYEDGLSTPRGSSGIYSLPNARLVSAVIADDVNLTSRYFTHFVMTWGQFIVHDTAMTLASRAGKNNSLYTCCPLKSQVQKPSSCFPIEIPDNDTFYVPEQQNCMSTSRAVSWTPDCKLGNPRRQLSQQTSFIDASVLYGVSFEETRKLRALKGGRLLSQITKHGELLPESSNPDTDQCSATLESAKCFSSGDYRVNKQPGSVAIQTIFLRQHNRIAGILASEYPKATDEEIFQETRRILGAQMQIITYGEFLSVVLGSEYMTYFNLTVLREGFTAYNPDVDPTTPTEFTTGAFRFGHTIIQNAFNQVNKYGLTEDKILLKDNMMGVFPVKFYEGKLDTILRGHFFQGAQEFDRHHVTSVTQYLFKTPEARFGLDILAIGIQSERDQGLPSYSKMVEYCFGRSVKTFDDMRTLMSEDNIDKLRIYRDVADIDFNIAGFLERPMEGAIVGPTFACIIGKHFQDLKDGDRFYFEHGNQTGSFTPGQLAEIRKTSLARIICDNSDGIDMVSPDLFRFIGDTNALKKCDSISNVNFTNWFDI